MGQVIRVTKPGYDVFTETNLYNFSLYSDSDNILIKELSRGSGTLALHAEETINHNLSYIPFFLVYGQVASGRYRVANMFDPLGSGWRSYVDTTSLFIDNEFDNTNTGYKYFLFYDNMD